MGYTALKRPIVKSNSDYKHIYAYTISTSQLLVHFIIYITSTKYGIYMTVIC
jgi:hypothetical protein